MQKDSALTGTSTEHQGRERRTATKGFEDLQAWQLARDLMLECHKLSDEMPPCERYDLASQIRRSSKSVMANIAEGYGRYHYLESLRFYYAARGSLNETINHIIVARDLTYIDEARFQALYSLGRQTERVLNGYIATFAVRGQATIHTAIDTPASQTRPAPSLRSEASAG